MDALKTNKRNLNYMNKVTMRDENFAQRLTLCHDQSKCIHDTTADLCVLSFV